MKATEVHKLTNEELGVEQQRLRRRLFDLRCQAVTEKLDNPNIINGIKRDIARILTEQTARASQEARA